MAPPQAPSLESLAIRSRSEVVILIHLKMTQDHGNTVIQIQSFISMILLIRLIQDEGSQDSENSLMHSGWDTWCCTWRGSWTGSTGTSSPLQIQCMYWLRHSFTLSLIPPNFVACHFILLVHVFVTTGGDPSTLCESMFSPTSRRAAPVPWQTVVRPIGNWQTAEFRMIYIRELVQLV